MRQIWIPRFGDTSVLEIREAPDPSPRRDEVRIRVAGAGVNFADLSARAGLYPDAPPAPLVVGYEVAGTIDEIGNAVSGYSVGDKVMSVTRFGGYSDVVCVPTHQIAHLHPTADPVVAAGIPVTYLTSYLMLVRLASLRPGDHVLIHSAAGGVGLSALQLAKRAGAVVLGTASASKHERLAEQGLDHAIDYRTQDFETEVMRITGGRGVDVVLDAQGGRSFRKSYRCLAPLGRLFCFGLASANANSRLSAIRTLPKALATTPVFHPMQLMNANKGVFGINLGHLWEQTSMINETLTELASLWESGDIRPVIDSTFPFAEAAAAHEQLQQARNFGKVILTP
ncbi:MAG TPA: medium chain dehydrogenase/reductase family protein [Acidimicrobiales bacterium]|nr:medium chain dehydrogenase/reductase family protein [Acidimicrobiales bacterium]